MLDIVNVSLSMFTYKTRIKFKKTATKYLFFFFSNKV